MPADTTFDRDAVREEVVGHLQTLLRFDTTNPPGNETEAARWIAGVLEREGIESTVLESAPGRGNIVARLEGTGEERPILLMSHMDVVPAEPEKWTHPPFGGEIHDGYIWGRGALDMKNTLAQHLTILLLFKRLADRGVRLTRDLIFMSAADEERSGTFGAQWLVENHPDLLRAEYALNEGGGTSNRIGDALLMTVQTAEKGLARFKLIARGEPGHASMPREDNAVIKLAEAVAAIGRARLPAHLTDTVRAFIEALASRQPPDFEAALRSLLDESKINEAIEQLPLDDNRRRYFYAITHNTAAPTILDAGSKINVFPSEAIARVDGRTLPGFTNSDFRRELEPYLPEGVELEFEEEGPALEAAVESPFFEAIVATLQEQAPEVTPVPILQTGATDAKALVKLGVKVYGFSPQRYEQEMEGLSLVHGHDERISIDNLVFGTEIVYDLLLRFCGPAR
jgi:acetylornithine deacetylase/succinyl-diaminopimelate desuccinylase-like protein